METPAIATRSYSTAGFPKSPSTKQLHDALGFLMAINTLMQGQPHVGPQQGALTDAECDAGEVAHAAGVSPEVFVAQVIAARAKARAPLTKRGVQAFIAAQIPNSCPADGAPLEQGRRRD